MAVPLKCLSPLMRVNKAVNDNLQQQAQAIYHSLFVSFDGISANQLYETELGLIPANWTVKPLSEVTTSIRARVKENDYKVSILVDIANCNCHSDSFIIWNLGIFSNQFWI